METNNYRGNSDYQDRDSRANNRGSAPYNKNSRNFDGQPNRNYRPRKNGGYRPNPAGGNRPQEDGFQGGYNKPSYYQDRNGYGNGNFAPRYHKNAPRPQFGGNRGGGYQGGYNQQGGYNPEFQGKGKRPRINRGSKFTQDEKGYFHKKYWDHSDRKQQAFDAAAESEDDFIENDGKIRLNKYLANSGMCSRREADRMIKAGMVQVNGETITEMGVKVNRSDEVKYNGMIVKPEHKRYLLLNKPKDYITTLKDPHARNTVMELIQGACKERVYPVGRLDRNTTGILLFTNDGDLAKKLTHPSNEVQKIYHVSLDKNVTKADMEQIAAGFELEDGFINADEVGYIDEMKKSEVVIRIHSGRNRIVRRIFEHLGYEVKKLDRIMFAGLDKKGLPRGRWRFLTEREIGFLNMISDKQEKEPVSAETVAEE
jgi:23S rRNA pseudouridine2605 synthase